MSEKDRTNMNELKSQVQCLRGTIEELAGKIDDVGGVVHGGVESRSNTNVVAQAPASLQRT